MKQDASHVEGLFSDKNNNIIGSIVYTTLQRLQDRVVSGENNCLSTAQPRQ